LRRPRAGIKPFPVVKTVASAGCTGWPVWTKGQSIAQQCISRGTELPTEIPPLVSGAWSVNTTPCSASQSQAAAL